MIGDCLKIDPNEDFAGKPMIRVRDFLRSISDTEVWGIERVEYGLELERSEAIRMISRLLEVGYIEERPGTDETYYDLTPKGNAFRMASAALPIHRTTADKRLKEFLERVEEIRDDPHYIFKVKKVLVFGSYLDKNRDRINDIDLAIEVVRKETDLEKHNELRMARIVKAHKEGKRFRNIIEEQWWPEIEVRMYLKSGKRSLSIHDIEDGILAITKNEVLYENSN